MNPVGGGPSWSQLEQFPCEERLRDGADSAWRARAQGGLAAAPGTHREVVEKREPERQGALAGPSETGSGAAEGKGCPWAGGVRGAGCPGRLCWLALGGSSPEGSQPRAAELDLSTESAVVRPGQGPPPTSRQSYAAIPLCSVCIAHT